MANIKSAKKRILVTETKAARNKAIKSGVKTAIKKVEAAVAANDKAAADFCYRKRWFKGYLPQEQRSQKSISFNKAC